MTFFDLWFLLFSIWISSLSILNSRFPTASNQETHHTVLMMSGNHSFFQSLIVPSTTTMWWELFSEGKIIPTVSKSTITHHQILQELAAIGKSLLNLAGFYTSLQQNWWCMRILEVWIASKSMVQYENTVVLWFLDRVRKIQHPSQYLGGHLLFILQSTQQIKHVQDDCHKGNPSHLPSLFSSTSGSSSSILCSSKYTDSFSCRMNLIFCECSAGDQAHLKYREEI